MYSEDRHGVYFSLAPMYPLGPSMMSIMMRGGWDTGVTARCVCVCMYVRARDTCCS